VDGAPTIKFSILSRTRVPQLPVRRRAWASLCLRPAALLSARCNRRRAWASLCFMNI